MIRVAKITDVPLIVEMGLKFAAVSEYKKFANKENIEQVVTNLISNPGTSIILMYDDVGMLAATTSKFIFGDVKLATEICWWVEPEARLKGVGQKLVDAYEIWIKIVGCEVGSMSCLDDMVGKFYEKNGYTLYERSYFKEF